MKTVFIGRYFEALTSLYKHSELTHVFIEKDKVPHEFYTFCKKNNITLIVIENNPDIIKAIQKYKIKESFLFSTSCGIIFSHDVINSFKLIINIHPGDIVTCRGAAPLLFAIKQKMPFMGFTAHIINSSIIDCGPILYQSMIPIQYDQSYQYNENLQLSILPETIRATLKILETPSFLSLEWFDQKKNRYNQRLPFAEWQTITSAPSLHEALRVLDASL